MSQTFLSCIKDDTYDINEHCPGNFKQYPTMICTKYRADCCKTCSQATAPCRWVLSSHTKFLIVSFFFNKRYYNSYLLFTFCLSDDISCESIAKERCEGSFHYKNLCPIKCGLAEAGENLCPLSTTTTPTLCQVRLWRGENVDKEKEKILLFEDSQYPIERSINIFDF